MPSASDVKAQCQCREFEHNDVHESFSTAYWHRMSILKANGPSVAVIYFDALRIAALRRDQIDHLAYHVTRLLAGERTASVEWEHLGLKIELEPDGGGRPPS